MPERNWGGEEHARQLLHQYLSVVVEIRAKDIHVIDFRGDHESGMWSALCEIPNSTDLYFLEQSLPTRRANLMVYTIATVITI